MASSSQRSSHQVERCLELAKLSRAEMQPVTQAIFLGENVEDHLLIEVDRELLNEVRNVGVIIRGDPEDDLILCTRDKTYSVREAEISNSLLAVPDLHMPVKGDEPKKDEIIARQVMNIFHLYWEPKQIRPSARKLHSILQETEFRGVEFDKDLVGTLYAFNELLDIIQSSQSELHELLDSLSALVINQKYRLLDFEYHFRVLEYLLNSIDNNSMPLDALNTSLVIEEVTELEPREVVEALVSWYVKDNALDKAKVSRRQAEVLLRNGRTFNLDDFLTAWGRSVPEGVDTDLEYLLGLCYVDKDRSRPIISYLSLWDLPHGEAARFEALLKLKICWTEEEIEPYVRDLTLGKVSSLLMKYARAFRKNGQLLYSKK